MKNIFSKAILAILRVSFLFNLIVIPINAEPLIISEDLIMAKVIEVIDGEAIKVIETHNDAQEVKLIRFIGVKTNASQEAMDYTYNQLIGKVVFLLKDDNAASFPKQEDWEYRYVYHTLAQSISEELLMYGYATIDEAFKNADQYKDLIQSEEYAKQKRFGLWKDYTELTSNSNKININVATVEDLMNHFEGLSSLTAYDIFHYREHNSFNTIEEIKFASDEIDKEWFDENESKLSVVTDINSAGINELVSLLSNYSNNEELAEKIKEYRLFHWFEKPEDLTKVEDIYETHVKSIERFIATTPVKEFIDPDSIVANINTATKNQIKVATNMSSDKLYDLLKLRDDKNYMFKTLGELEKGTDEDLEIKKYIDNLSIYTNVNTAGEYELKTIFGGLNISDSTLDTVVKNVISTRPFLEKKDIKKLVGAYYDDIEPYIYTKVSELPKLVNINLSSKTYVVSVLDMESIDAKKYTTNKYHYTYYRDFNFSYKPYKERISIYTNINTASYDELNHLASTLSSSMVNRIIEYRQEQPFTSLGEVNDFFSEHGHHHAYTQIKDYIVFY